ncbi:hypothetical protein [Rhodococcus sp. LB1]|uniref:hypothetical protein n=1 Tax=Rhodococcus sp. LB1 TaxID=1807499 RepID=UPI001E4E1BDB|nr:hypothetical protein [Rhodococcus sp. LB1]
MQKLTGGVWAETFAFRPTFENVARWAYGELCSSVPQPSYVELDNETIGVTTRYLGAG